MQIASCNVFVYQRSEIANFKSVKVNEPGRLYFDVTCRFTLHWVFGDTSNVVSGSVFYLFPIQSLSTLQEMKGHLTCAIDVLSNPDENDTEKRLDAVRTLNSLVAALSVNDGDYYDAIDIAFEEIRE